MNALSLITGGMLIPQIIPPEGVVTETVTETVQEINISVEVVDTVEVGI